MPDQKTKLATETMPGIGSSELLACPMCGSVPSIVREGKTVFIQCNYDCNTSIGPEQWARRDWNAWAKQERENAG